MTFDAIQEISSLPLGHLYHLQNVPRQCGHELTQYCCCDVCCHLQALEGLTGEEWCL